MYQSWLGLVSHQLFTRKAPLTVVSMVYGEVDHDLGISDPLLIRICHLIELQLRHLMIAGNAKNWRFIKLWCVEVIEVWCNMVISFLVLLVIDLLHYSKKCIPVGYVQTACCPYLPACTAQEGGVCSQGGRGGCLLLGVCVSQHTLRQTPPPVNRMTDRQV